MVTLHNIRQFLLDKGWKLQGESNFLPPADLGFGEGFSLYVPSLIDEKSDILKDLASLLSGMYQLEKNNIILSVSQFKDILSIRINDADNNDGAIALDTFEYFIEKTKGILFKTAQFVVENKPKLEGSDIEAKKYLSGCRFLQTNKGSFITNISLPTDDIIVQGGLLNAELKAKTINEKVFSILNFVHSNFFTESIEDGYNVDTQTIVNQNRDLINVDVLKEVKCLYDKSLIGNITFDFFDYERMSNRRTNPEVIGLNNIESLKNFINEVEADLRKDMIDSYGKVIDLNSKDWKTDDSSRKITLETHQYGSTPVVLSINKEQYNLAIESHKKIGMVKIKGSIEKTSKYINVKEIEELVFM